jgi:hypothetical protein
MELWGRIDAQREQQKQLAFQDRKRWGVLLLLLFFMAAGLSSLILLSAEKEEPSLSNFPIQIKPMAESPKDPAANIEEELVNAIAEVVVFKSEEVVEPSVGLSLTGITGKKEIVPATPIESFHVESDIKQTKEKLSSQLLFADMVSLPNVQHMVINKNKYLDGVKCAAFKPEEKGNWTLDILASPDWSFRSLAPKESAYADYVESREATESPDFNYSAGMRVSYVHPSGFLGRVGLNYSQINEKFEFSAENEEVITIRNIYGPLGDVIGTDTLIETSINRKFTNNRFESIDIPVIFGYQKNLKKLSISANAGFLFNVLFHSKGDFLSPMNGEPVSFDKNTPDSYPAFRKSLGVGLYAGLSLSYPVNAKLQFIVEPHLKTYPKTITRDQYMVNQKYLFTGLSIGVRHQL